MKENYYYRCGKERNASELSPLDSISALLMQFCYLAEARSHEGRGRQCKNTTWMKVGP